MRRLFQAFALTVLLVGLGQGAACFQVPPPLPPKNDALGAWLPRPAFNTFKAFYARRASKTEITDSFTYAPRNWFGGPADGLGFQYGKAGPPRASVVYDPRSRIAFYDVGCCSWHDTVLASDVAAPPGRLPERDLEHVGTKSGILLGDNPSKVRDIYGKASLIEAKVKPGYSQLAYYKPQNASCDWFDNFIFLHDKLVIIELDHGC